MCKGRCPSDQFSLWFPGGHLCHSSLELHRECIPIVGTVPWEHKPDWETWTARAQPETVRNKICRKTKKKTKKKYIKGYGGSITWQLTTMSSSSSVLPELPSLVWFSLLVCAERSPFGVQLPRLPRNLDRFVSIRRFCRMLWGCLEEEHTQKSRVKSEESHTVVCATRLPVVPMGQRCSHRRVVLYSYPP